MPDSEIEERLEIDHDTRGLPGSPDIVSSILQKIDDSKVFIADITPIAISESGKHIANPNVLIELGYAKKTLGVSRVITVWNTAFTQSRPEDLPFDLRGRRGPISYSLDVGASRELLGKARSQLVEGLVDRIGGCLGQVPLASPSALKWHEAIEGDPSLWIEPDKEIDINEDFGSGKKTFIDGGRWYVRVIPSKFNQNSLDSVSYGPFPGSYGGFSSGHVAGGLMTYAGSVRADTTPELEAASIWFRDTGEIWLFQTRVGGEYRGRKVFYGDYVVEKWGEKILSCLKALVKIGAQGPYHVRLGVTGLAGLHWEVGQNFGGNPPIALEPSLETEFSVAGLESDHWREDFTAAWTSLRRIFGMGIHSLANVDLMLAKVSR